MMQGEYSVSLKDMIEALKLENCTPDVDINDIMITQNEVNRRHYSLQDILTILIQAVFR